MVLLDFTGLYLVLLSFSAFLPGFTGFYRVLLSFTGFYRVFFRVILGFTWFSTSRGVSRADGEEEASGGAR